MHAHGRYLPYACTLNLTVTLTLFLRAQSPLFISVIIHARARIRYQPCADDVMGVVYLKKHTPAGDSSRQISTHPKKDVQWNNLFGRAVVTVHGPVTTYNTTPYKGDRHLADKPTRWQSTRWQDNSLTNQLAGMGAMAYGSTGMENRDEEVCHG